MKKFHWYDHISINIFWFGLNIRNTAVGNVFTPYLIALFVPAANRNTALGAISTAGLVIAMLVQPAAGLLSDQCTSRLGRRRPFILIGTLFDLIFLAAIALSGSFWMLLVATLLIQFSANVSHGPLQGLIPDLVPEEQRGRSSAIKAMMELVAIVLVGFTIAQLVGKGHLILAAIITGAVLVITMLLTLVLVKEKPLQEKSLVSFRIPMLRVLGMLAGIALGALAGLLGGSVIGGLIGLAAWSFVGKATALAIMVGIGGVVAMVVAVIIGVWSGAYATLGQDARRQSSFTWWVVNRLLFLAAATSLQGFLPYFLMYVFNIDIERATSLNGTLMTVLGLLIVVSALAGGWISDRIGAKRVVAISGWIAALGGVMILVTLWFPSMAWIYIAGGVIGLGTGLFMTANWALGTELAPSEEAGRYLGISNLAGAGAGMIGKGIGGPIADYLNMYSPGFGYFAIFSCYAILFAMSAVSLIWVKKGRNE